ncbi:NAD(P)H-dependent oxidoreductase [Sphingomonas sp. PP-CC-3A-396]|uniref:FMN-dependent NADH-azoreductase n=1 Tax=Sphingomonas sp. PP-CC-3A-396 TaxID=2135655 RepID=UPI00104D2B74|nr:NAD(P)H-dependent oxidoreductase [Sphingomonas sp. PP-CC-3A-396]TCQ06519.1 FMN-dependent NADH-azoreductase [Sphingomonas sp. PP-CC-3A-396]
MKILHIDSSILGDHSVSRMLSGETVARLQAEGDDVTVTYRDLSADPIMHLSGAYLSAQHVEDAQHDEAMRDDLATGAAVLEEFLAADTIVIGVAFYNFTVPSQLKSWIDRILIAHRTFRYTTEGKVEGLAGGKRVVLTVARGGFYGVESPSASNEHGESYMRAALGFIGIHDPEVIIAEGVATGAAARAAAIQDAKEKISMLRA